MKRAALAIVSTVAALVMLLSFKTHSLGATASPPAAVASTGTAGSTSATPSPSTSSASSSTATSTKTTTTTKSYTGGAADTRYGPVQVRITVSAGKLVSVEAIDYPTNDPRDQQINSYAIPALNAEAKAAGNANIDMISGATFTSEGYVQSLQSALDQAGL